MREPGEEYNRIFWGIRNVLNLDDLGGNTSVYMCEKSSSCTLKIHALHTLAMYISMSISSISISNLYLPIYTYTYISIISISISFSISIIYLHIICINK